MDIRELKIFLTTAELLNFGRASQVCNLSPSALTRTIQRLEEQLGQTLFVRDNRTVQLSLAGEQFCVYARQAVRDFQSLQDSLSIVCFQISWRDIEKLIPKFNWNCVLVLQKKLCCR